MNRPYTSQDLEDFYYKIFRKYNISSIEELEEAIRNGTISEEELLLKLDDLISLEQRKMADIQANSASQNVAITGLQPNSDDQNDISAPNDL